MDPTQEPQNTSQSTLLIQSHEGLTEAQIADRFVNRRQMAWWSFYLIAFVGTALIFFGLWSDDYATRIDRISFIVGTVFGVWAGIVLAYFGASAYSDTRGMK